jgi:hypothetical protein
VENNPKNYQDVTSLNTDDYNDHRITVDVYHHFDENIKELVLALTKFIDNPIQIETSESTIPTGIALDPGTPQINTIK